MNIVWPTFGGKYTLAGASQQQLKAMILRVPQLIGDDFDSCISPSLECVQAALAIDDSELLVLVTKLPQILGGDYAEEIKPRIDVLRAEIEKDIGRWPRDSELAVKLKVLAKPSVLGIEVRGHHSAGVI